MGWRLRLSGKTVRKFADVAYGTQFLAVYGLCRYSRGFAGERASSESGVVKNGDFSFVQCFPNILHTWPHDSFHVIRLSITLAIGADF